MGKQINIYGSLLCAAIALSPASGQAADMLPAPMLEPLATTKPFFVHVGPGNIRPAEGARIKLNGTIQPGADVSIASQVTLAFEAGYYVTPNVAVSVTGGFPPTGDIMGKGTIAGLGRLGRMTAGPAAVTAHYHFTNFGAFQPYIGAGPTFLIVFGTKDDALANLKVNNAVGFAGQIGFDYMFNERWGMFVDFKKAFLRTTATGLLFGLPSKSAVKVDPFVMHTGVTYRF